MVPWNREWKSIRCTPLRTAQDLHAHQFDRARAKLATKYVGYCAGSNATSAGPSQIRIIEAGCLKTLPCHSTHAALKLCEVGGGSIYSTGLQDREVRRPANNGSPPSVQTSLHVRLDTRAAVLAASSEACVVAL